MHNHLVETISRRLRHRSENEIYTGLEHGVVLLSSTRSLTIIGYSHWR